MKKITNFLCFLFAVSLIMASHCMAGEMQVIAGAGPSTTVVQLFVKKFISTPEAKGYNFKVPPKSSKHAGGIKASDKFVFGRTGRPLNIKEKSLGKNEIFLAQVPIAFAVGPKAGVSSLTLPQVESIFTGRVTNWQEVGGANGKIVTIGRESKEALFSVLKQKYPFFNTTKFKHVVKKDNHVVDLLKKTQGQFGIGFGAKPNFEKGALSSVSVDGFLVGVSIGLVYDNKNNNHELVVAAKQFVKSDEWAKAVAIVGLIPPQ